VIPSAFSIALYQQRLDEKSAKPVALLGAKVEGWVTNLVAGPAANFTPTILPKVTVVVEDLRPVSLGEDKNAAQYFLEPNQPVPGIAEIRRLYSRDRPLK
jgi:hypothetical protein